MSSQPYVHMEQDHNIPKDGNELPTYDDLAVQGGPNSRFGRWRGWIEKRAAERYVDITPEERNRRRERGWGNDAMEESAAPIESVHLPVIINEPPTPTPMNLHIQTSNLSPNISYQSSTAFAPSVQTFVEPERPLPAVSMKLHPTHLKMNQFGSRFLPHTKTPIRCLLPLLSGKYLLIGHDEGLSVLDMYPQEWTETGGISVKGPEEAQARPIWQGESVYQMSLLEIENNGEATPQGVVLVLVGPESESPSGKDPESLRSLRMYNLASLISLAKWTVAQKGSRQPLDLRRPSNWTAQQTTTPKKHRPQSSIARGLRSLMIDSPSNHHEQSSSYQALLSPSSTIGSVRSRRNHSRPHSPSRNDSDDSTSSWDMVDDLPLRWATDFVPLATPGSRLVNSSVLSYALWNSDEHHAGRGDRLLAVVTKTNILLYETPKGERAFRFLKEFYTPMQPRSVTFFQQIPTDVSRSPTDTSFRHHSHSHNRSQSNGSGSRDRTSMATISTISYGVQLSLFVIFDKKAGWIRLADSAVGEIELFDDGSGSSLELSNSVGNLRRSRISLVMDHPKWIPIGHCEIPSTTTKAGPTPKVHLLTKGKQTHVLPSPLPVGSGPTIPLFVVNWKSPPTHVTPRVSGSFEPDLDGHVSPPYMQLVGMGQQGVEVQEIPLTLLSVSGKGKGKAKAPSPDTSIRANEDAGGDTGFLCMGGHWDRPEYSLYARPGLDRSYSTSSDMSFRSMSSEDILLRMKKEEGIYGWCRKGLEDWRVFWLGGALTDEYDDD